MKAPPLVAPARDLVDCICLVYHEARNAKRPLREGKLPSEARYARIRMLAQNRVAAWRQMAPARASARTARSAVGAADVFRATYRLTLQDLRDLFEAPVWWYSPLGGRKWAVIAARVLEAVEAWDSVASVQRRVILDGLLDLPHHSGTLRTKLDLLESAPVAMSP